MAAKAEVQPQERISTEFTELNIKPGLVYFSGDPLFCQKVDCEPLKIDDEVVSGAPEWALGFYTCYDAEGTVLIFGHEIRFDTESTASPTQPFGHSGRTFINPQAVLSKEEVVEETWRTNPDMSARIASWDCEKVVLTRPNSNYPQGLYYGFRDSDKVVYNKAFEAGTKETARVVALTP